MMGKVYFLAPASVVAAPLAAAAAPATFRKSRRSIFSSPFAHWIEPRALCGLRPAHFYEKTSVSLAIAPCRRGVGRSGIARRQGLFAAAMVAGAVLSTCRCGFEA